MARKIKVVSVRLPDGVPWGVGVYGTTVLVTISTAVPLDRARWVSTIGDALKETARCLGA